MKKFRFAIFALALMSLSGCATTAPKPCECPQVETYPKPEDLPQ